jgi:[ribosomal protein S5]-alanine N-acetyltransferase
MYLSILSMETERLLIQPWARDDWRAFRPIATDPEVMRYIGSGEIWSDERIVGFVERQIDGLRVRGYALWKLVEKENEGLIGFCGLQPLRETGETEIGWWLARDRWGRGLATEATRHVLHHGLDEIGLERIVAIAQPENTASVNVMRKIGMRFERSTSHGELGIPDPEIALVMYAIEADSAVPQWTEGQERSS